METYNPSDPVALLGRFMDRQQRSEQFTEDIRKVIHGNPLAPAAIRARSPGLAAGAALALGGCSAAEAQAASADARAACRKAVERSRGSSCPFDDHSAFGASPADMRSAPGVRAPLAALNDARQAHQQAQEMRRYNRDIQQKVGAGAPFDAPEACVPAVGSTAEAQRGAVLGVSQSVAAVNDSRLEAIRNKNRMRGAQDLISGNYLQSDSGRQPVGRKDAGGLPPRPPDLLPQAQMKLQYDGGSIASLSAQRAEYLNARVLAESNQFRNENRSPGFR